MTQAQVSGLILWGGVTFLGLLILFGMGFALSLGEAVRARNWIETPCVIKLSQMDRRDQGKMYWNVVYSYQYEGQEYSSRRFEIMDHASDTWAPIADLVDAFPPGKTSVCYVDPSDPENAILSKRLPGLIWLTSIPAVLMLAGVVGMLLQMPRPDLGVPFTPSEEVDPLDIQDDEPKKGAALRYFEHPLPQYPSPTSSPLRQTARHI